MPLLFLFLYAAQHAGWSDVMLAGCHHHVLCFCAMSTVNTSITLDSGAKAYNVTALNVDADYMFWMYSITRLGRSESSSKAAFIRTSSSCKLQLFFYHISILISHSVSVPISAPQAPGSNVPLICLLILVLYISFARLRHLLPHLPFFFTFFLGGHKRQPNVGFLSFITLFYAIVFLCFWCLVICVLLA